MATYVALLRGINLGARNKVPMGQLRSSLTAAGFEDVATYVQSGNVVLRRRGGSADEVAAEIEQQVANDFGVAATVVVRTPAQLDKVARGNPFLAEETDPLKLHVVFLERAPQAAASRRLDPERSSPDRFSVRGRDIYLHLPNGFHRSKLTLDYFESTLGVTGTVRNWRTLTKLVALASEPQR